MCQEGVDILGPAQDVLFTGEAMTVMSQLVLGRRASSKVTVRVVGGHLLAGPRQLNHGGSH